MTDPRRACAAVLLAALSGCATLTPARSGAVPEVPVPGTVEATRDTSFPPIPFVDGELRLEVGYPLNGAALTTRDRNFIFGSTGSGRATLTINGTPVELEQNGGFLAFIPVPEDGVYRLVASRDGMTVSLETTVTLPPAPIAGAPGTTGAAFIAQGSDSPVGAIAAAPGEAIEIAFRGPRGGDAWLVLSGGDRIRLVEAGAVDPASVPAATFLTQRPQPDAQAGAQAAATVRYEGVLPARPMSDGDLFELIVGADTARTAFRGTVSIIPAGNPRIAVATAPAEAPPDWRARGRNDITGPYHYFWPPGTVFRVTGERGGMLRVDLGAGRTAWLPAGEVQLMAEGTPPPTAFVGDVRFYHEPSHIDLRLPIQEKLPFQVVVDGSVIHFDVFGALGRTNFFQYGQLDPLVERAEWSQLAEAYRVSVWLTEPVWGYDTFFDPTGAAVLRIRRPPTIDASDPLRGLTIVVDAGHGGVDRATRGPTGLAEADANLSVALALGELLEERGAEVIFSRTTDATVPLADRPRLATEANADLLVSVHNNAFPDGVEPRANHGTSSYYFHPPSAALAQMMQRELLDELGTRDLGVGRADLALVRPTWMPSVLSETLFMMIPEHEAALRDAAVRGRIAMAHVRALEAFAARQAQAQGTR